MKIRKIRLNIELKMLELNIGKLLTERKSDLSRETLRREEAIRMFVRQIRYQPIEGHGVELSWAKLDDSFDSPTRILSFFSLSPHLNSVKQSRCCLR